MVTVTAVVRDHKGRFVRDLSREKVRVLDRGRLRAITDFRVDDEAPVSLALLFDESGSMSVASKAHAARDAAAQVLAALDPRRDEVAVFSFESELHQLQAFTSDLDAVRRKLEDGEPWGTTALFDAIGQTSAIVGQRTGRHRAVVVLTDGVDTSSRLRPEEVSAAASEIDVPVYVLSVVSPLDHPGADSAVPTQLVDTTGELASLASWTGGDSFVMSTPAHASIAARTLVSELRHQYLIAFEAAQEPGWHPIEIRVPEKDARIQTRSGYVVGRPRSAAVGQQ
jgi:VWFA-related protein